MLLYIDPGTGSMLITILLAAIGTLFYFVQGFILKLKYTSFSGNRNDEVEDIVIFSDDKRYWKIFEPICDELEKKQQKVVYLSLSEDDPAFDRKSNYFTADYLGTYNKAFAKMNRIRANIVLSTTPNLEVYQWKRSKDVKWYVHIPHAPTGLTRYKMFGTDFYDAILLTGEYQRDVIRKLERIREVREKELYVVGVPYMDVMMKKLSGIEKKEKGNCRTILLAPSWGKSGLLTKYGSEIIDRLISTGNNIVIRPHPQSFTSEKDMIDKLMNQYPENEKLQWNRDIDSFNAMAESDIMISDFSGVMFEYALIFDKPFIYTSEQFDKTTYDADWLDEEPWTIKTLPKIGMKLDESNFEKLDSMIEECLNSREYSEGRKEAKAETWQFVGESAERASDYLINKLKTLKEKDTEIIGT